MKKQINFEDIFQNTSSGLIVTDSNGIITHMNTRAEIILALDAATQRGKDIKNILPLIASPVQACLQTGEPTLNYQLPCNRDQLLVNVTPVIKDSILGAVCSFEKLSGIEASVKNTLSYKSLNRQLENIFHASSDGLWVCDGNGIVISINAASEMLNGIKSTEIIGHDIGSLLHNGVFDQSVTTKVMASGKRETIMQYIHKTNRYLLSTGTPSIDGNGNIEMIIVNERDMTELNSLRRQIEQNQKEKEKYEEELSELSLLEVERNSIIAESNKMRQVLQMSLKLSHIGASNILILGESGTGKGLLAKLIHKNSQRRKKPFIEINCAALPENLLEAELFGYEKGAFTGASEKGKIGLFELAQGGTIFLDEMGDMPIALQAKILKYLDNNTIRRLGGTESITINCATIAATNQDLKQLVKKKLFREDLYYRLSSFIIQIPPLRERIDDISGLVRFYLNEYNQKYSCSKTISPGAMRILQTHAFQGNIRELKSIIENAVVMSETNRIDTFVQTSVLEAKSKTIAAGHDDSLNLKSRLDAIEKLVLQKARDRCRTTREMAALLGISQPSVVRKLHKHQMRTEEKTA
jgi:PAS domain S-box-containing protein